MKQGELGSWEGKAADGGGMLRIIVWLGLQEAVSCTALIMRCSCGCHRGSGLRERVEGVHTTATPGGQEESMTALGKGVKVSSDTPKYITLA